MGKPTDPFNSLAAHDKGVKLNITSDPANLREARLAVESLCQSAGFNRKHCDEIGLCVNEALANVMRHAYHGAADRPIQVEAQFVDGELRIFIRDWGTRFDPIVVQRKRKYDPLEPGGLGLICMRQLMDEVTYAPQPDGTLLTMRKKKC